MVSRGKRVFVGNADLIFEIPKRPSPLTLTVQARMEIVRKSTGTDKNPLEDWELTGSRVILATSGFETHKVAPKLATLLVKMDMRADTDSWFNTLSELLLPAKFLDSTRKQFAKELKAKSSRFERGHIWEEQI